METGVRGGLIPLSASLLAFVQYQMIEFATEDPQNHPPNVCISKFVVY